MVVFPPRLTTDLTVGHVFRFKSASAATAIAVTAADLMDLLMMSATATSAYRLIASARVRRVDVFASASAGTNATVSVEFAPDTTVAGARHMLVSDTTLGSARPAAVNAVPNKTSLAGMWMSDASTTTIFTVSSDVANSIVDVHLTFTLRNNEAASAVASVSGLTAGTVYCHYLDGHGGQYVPVGWTAAS